MIKVSEGRRMNAMEHGTSRQTEQRKTIERVLDVLLTIQESETGTPSLHEKLISLQKKLASNQLHLAVLGQMKRGKSSLINALLGSDILPTGVLPVTAVITEIKYGPAPEATIVYSNGLRERVDVSRLAAFITECGNPGNRKRVASVELAYPSPLLESGIILIDTPGIGSTHVHNTRTTEGYLEQVDAGIVVLSVDPPITEVESQFLRNLKREIPKLFFILNKVDTVSFEEVSLISHFLEEELELIHVEAPEIFCLSAHKALEGRRAADPNPGGLEVFEERLQTFLAEEKGEVLLRSIALDALQIARTLRFAATIGVRARSMSPGDLDQKRLALDGLLEQADSELHELQVLLRQHSVEILACVEQDLKTNVQESLPGLQQELKLFPSRHPDETGRVFGSLLESFLMGQIENVFRRWRIREDEVVQAQLDVLSARLVARANVVMERLLQATSAIFEIPEEMISTGCPLRVESRLDYRIERVFHSLDSFLLALPRFLLRPIVLRKIARRAWQLLDLNAGRIRYDYVERLQSTMTQFEKDLSAPIAMVTQSLRSALFDPRGNAQAAVLEKLDLVIGACSALTSGQDLNRVIV
jgi:GTP-binding protein EngB required for normal cell division